MNVLIDKLPTVAVIDGEEYPLDTDFRTCLKIMQAFEDPDLTDYEKRYVMLRLLYGENIPRNVQEAVRYATLFLDCGEDYKTTPSEERIYSFDHDAKYIYSGIKRAHDVNLNAIEYLHWWEFVYMFMDLPEDCFFTQLRGLRYRKAHGKLTKEEKEYVAQMADVIDLPIIRTAEETEAENQFMNLLNNN